MSRALESNLTACACSCVLSLFRRWTIVTEMSASRSAAGVTIFEGRIYVSGGHDGLQIFNTVSDP